MEPHDNKNPALQAAVGAHEPAVAALADPMVGESTPHHAALHPRLEQNLGDLQADASTTDTDFG